MSKWNYVCDDQIVIAIDGLRTVSKSETLYMNSPLEKYYLTVEYKGLHQQFTYAIREDRDKIFDEIISRIKENK